jgi:homeobox protein cut-like
LPRQQELKKQFDIISELRADIKGLQADNLKLYEKIRYMQSYQGDSLGAGPSASASSVYSRAQQPTSNGDSIGKYRSLYEQNMNPFEAFRGRVSAIIGQVLSA